MVKLGGNEIKGRDENGVRESIVFFFFLSFESTESKKLIRKKMLLWS